MIDGVWEARRSHVAMSKLVFTFLGSDITFNTISMSEIEKTQKKLKAITETKLNKS
jgi:hypothetical protein